MGRQSGDFLLVFQYYTSPIQTTDFNGGLEEPHKFQYYTSPIQTRLYDAAMAELPDFNTTLVRFKRK